MAFLSYSHFFRKSWPRWRWWRCTWWWRRWRRGLVSDRRIADIKLSPEWPVTAPTTMQDLGTAQSPQNISPKLQKFWSGFKSYVHLTLATTVFRVRPTYLSISKRGFTREEVSFLLSPNLFPVMFPILCIFFPDTFWRVTEKLPFVVFFHSLRETLVRRRPLLLFYITWLKIKAWESGVWM